MKRTKLSDDRIARLRCDACGQRKMARVRQPYTEEVSHDGRPPVKIVVPDVEVVACANPECSPDDPDHSVIFDDYALWQIADATYRQLGLLTPDEIRAGREKLGLTQVELGELLRLGGNSLSRWESGAVYQSRSMDTLLRIVFQSPQVLEQLRGSRHCPTVVGGEAESAVGSHRV